MSSTILKLPGVALITGAGGTGKSLDGMFMWPVAYCACTRFAITDLNKDTLAQTRGQILSINPDADVLAEPGDISEKSHVESLITQAAKRFERLDYAVNCAGEPINLERGYLLSLV